MLSNLSVRSNLIENCLTPADYINRKKMGTPPLTRITARDLHELSCLNPIGLSNIFDKETLKSKSSGLPTTEQLRQWEKYLFYGDKTVSLAQQQRLIQCWYTAAEYLIMNWDQIREKLDLEISLESLCIILATRKYLTVESLLKSNLSPSELGLWEKIPTMIEKFLRDEKGIEVSEAYNRAQQVLGLTD
jgi:hypothetical protein